ncbi:MAG: ferrous iron transport protein B [Pyrinomonadaceae bacterium]
MSAILQSDQNAVSAERGLARPLSVAIAGNPNAGKTSLFNSLTGLRQKVANYPGVTVESKNGLWVLDPHLPAARIIDLPGLYSLDATSLDEQIARDIMLGRVPAVADPDVIVVVVDATNLVRNLYLVTQLLETGRRLVVALTMIDLAERAKLEIDTVRLSEALGVAVVPVVAKQGRGIDRLGQALLKAVEKSAPGARWRFSPEVEAQLALLSGNEPSRRYSAMRELFSDAQPKNTDERTALEQSRQKLERADPNWRQQPLIARYEWIERVVNQSLLFGGDGRLSSTERIDAVMTHKIAGPMILLLVMLLVFQSIFSWANLPMNLIDHVFSALRDGVRGHLPVGLLTDLLVDGVIAGVGGVLVFLPQILLLFFFISILEDSGYMARAAFLMDRLMRTVGLNGKAFMPLLSSFACAVPGIMATRTIESPKDRIATIMIAPFMSCSARLPVYTLMIAACFSDRKILGVISAGVVIILAMYLLGVLVAILVAWILKATLLNAPAPPFVMELPPYRLPQFANVAHVMFERAGLFVKRAGTVILAISILLWALVAFPRRPGNTPSEQVQQSFAGQAGRAIEPVITPLGFDWKIGVGLISSFAARETIVSTLSIVYNVGDEAKGQSGSLVEALRKVKRLDGSPAWTPLVALSLMVFFVLACQCMSTLAVVRRETNSWRWPLFMVAYMLALAYVGSLITYQGGRLLGFG